MLIGWIIRLETAIKNDLIIIIIIGINLLIIDN